MIYSDYESFSFRSLWVINLINNWPWFEISLSFNNKSNDFTSEVDSCLKFLWLVMSDLEEYSKITILVY